MSFKYRKKIVLSVAKKMEALHSGESSGHDWWHTYRVWRLAGKIARSEKKATPDFYVVELSALLHDIADYKFNEGDETLGPERAKNLLEELGVPEGIGEKVSKIISEMNFPGTKGKPRRMSSIEGEIVRDADFLDAMGAIGIGRTFAYGGKKGRPMYEPTVKPKLLMSREEYRKRGATHTINHFYEKLLRLDSILHTKEAKRIGRERKKRMEKFLSEFFSEWKGKS